MARLECAVPCASMSMDDREHVVKALAISAASARRWSVRRRIPMAAGRMATGSTRSTQRKNRTMPAYLRRSAIRDPLAWYPATASARP